MFVFIKILRQDNQGTSFKILHLVLHVFTKLIDTHRKNTMTCLTFIYKIIYFITMVIKIKMIWLLRLGITCLCTVGCETPKKF